MVYNYLQKKVWAYMKFVLEHRNGGNLKTFGSNKKRKVKKISGTDLAYWKMFASVIR